MLGELVREEIARHPSGHLAASYDGALHLELRVDAQGRPSPGSRQSLEEGVRETVDRLLHRRSVLRPGRVWCLRCASAECEHSEVPDARQTFSGWSPSGVPRFQDFAQVVLEREPERIDPLYRDPPGLVALVQSGRELAEGLLPAFRDADDVRIHGQVVAGWYQIPETEGDGTRALATSLQIVSTSGRKGRRRLHVHVVGAGLGDQELEHLLRRLGRLPWSDAARWAQGVLLDVERTQRRAGVKAEQLSARIEGIFGSVARRLEQTARSRARRTDHAEQRHRQGDRPTRDAMADLQAATVDSVLRDKLRSTWIVLGSRKRAHVFSDAGKLVTSLRSSPEATQRKRDQGRWQPVSEEQVEALKGTVLQPSSG